MPDTKTPTELTSQYTAQVVGDLERNAKEQERIGAEIDALQEQLNALRHDHAVLTNLHQALGATSPFTESDPEPTPVPSVPQQKTPAKSARSAKSADGKRRRARKADAEPGAAALTASAKKAADKATSAQPTLIDLIRGYLTDQSEPRSAAEVSTALGETHPDRRIQTNVVRTTLENLVAKSHAHRAKQGSSVFYTAVDAPEPKPAASAPSEEQPTEADNS
ncbi:hypothetical protein ABZX90_25380 [Streptomyces sp. NPDC002935]|uniref:hypothetical protein n=1 Tax=Streptomyces sp. NPDC002935 TaxID=3154545 RepID=UPI0033A10E87